ncbi:MAG: hypothetical protein KR126chlam2_01200 [Chlamydiae bacterium]|nr:hypothetical protein [Chlamydiota bacterium]
MFRLLDKIPGASGYKQKAIGYVDKNPRAFAIAAVAGGAMLLIGALYGISLPLSVAIPLLITAVVVVVGKFVMNKYLKGAHGDKAWFKIVDRVLTIAFPILVAGGAIAAGSLYGMMLTLPAAASATVLTLMKLSTALGLPLLAMAVGMRIGNRELDKAVEKAKGTDKEKWLRATRNSLQTVQAILAPAVYVGILGWMLAGGPTTIYFTAGLIMTPFLYPIVKDFSIPTLKAVTDDIEGRSRTRRIASENRRRTASTAAALCTARRRSL